MTHAPIFEITHLHIRGLRGLRALDLPQDGMGWNDGFPPVAVIGGANGSGKTTLLQCIADAAATLAASAGGSVPKNIDADECLIDWQILSNKGTGGALRFLVGHEDFTERHFCNDCFGYTKSDLGIKVIRAGIAKDLYENLRSPDTRGSTLPRLVFFPSENRDLYSSKTGSDRPSSLYEDIGFVTKWSRSGLDKRTLVDVLYAARWADLNAKDLGKPEEARNFERYTKSFTDLTLGEKRLTWTTSGDLVVELKSGTQHELQELSSGERQALLLLAELRRYWKPGSLILIDELELHLHDAWQGKLYDVIKAMQAELGGQVIITTQSHSLFEMADLGTRALLGRGSLR